MASARGKKKNGEATAVPVDEAGPVVRPQGQVLHGLDGARHRRSIKKAEEDIREVMRTAVALIENEIFPFYWHLSSLIPNDRAPVREAAAMRMLFDASLFLLYKTGTSIDVVRGWLDDGWITIEQKIGRQVVAGQYAASVLRSDVICPECACAKVRIHAVDVLGRFYFCPICKAFWEVPEENNL